MATETDAVTEAAEGAEKPPRLNLDVKIEKKGACQRHVLVQVPREDIERYYDKTFSDMMGSAQVPGFRAGKVPRKLIEHKFRKEVADQIKSSILVDSLTQISDEQNLAAISEPNLDVEAVVLPTEGPLTFEFDIEVRPEFDLPQWKGLKIEKPVAKITDEDVKARIQEVLADRAELETVESGAKAGESVVEVEIVASKDGKEVARTAGQRVNLLSTLRLADATVEGFDKLLAGAKAGEERKTKVKISSESANEALRGQEVELTFKLERVAQRKALTLTPDTLRDIGVESEEELKKLIQSSLERQVAFRQQQAVRKQVLAALTASANWELPPDLLRRQANRELERSVLEMRRSGFSEREVMAHEAQLRQQSLTQTERALKEHFVLERIAEDEKIEDSPQDYDLEISLIAEQSGQSSRRVRAYLEKNNMMDTLRNQIIERKVIEKILEQAKFEEKTEERPKTTVEACDWEIGATPPAAS